MLGFVVSMNTTSGSITHSDDTSTTEDVLLTYSEEEKQQNEINSANAALLFRPEFIPYYPAVKRQYGLTDTETVLFGFIRFFMGSANKRFYFTNEQLAELIDCTPSYVTKSLKRLEEVGLIETSRRMKAGGGQIRFVTKCNLLIAKSATSSLQKVQGNKNKIKENKINTTTNVVVGETPSVAKSLTIHGNGEINQAQAYFLERMQLPKEDVPVTQSRRYWHLLLTESRRGFEGVKWLINLAAEDPFWRNNITSSRDLYYKRMKLVTRKRGTAPRVAVQGGGGLNG